MTVILPGRLRHMTDELITEVFVKIEGRDAFKQLRNGAGLSIQSEYPRDVDADGWTQCSPEKT